MTPVARAMHESLRLLARSPDDTTAQLARRALALQAQLACAGCDTRRTASSTCGSEYVRVIEALLVHLPCTTSWP